VWPSARGLKSGCDARPVPHGALDSEPPRPSGRHTVTGSQLMGIIGLLVALILLVILLRLIA
jgi:hypothetical protein